MSTRSTTAIATTITTTPVLTANTITARDYSAGLVEIAL